MHKAVFNAGSLPPYASYTGEPPSDIFRLQPRNNNLALLSKIGVDIRCKLAYIECIETHTTELKMLEAILTTDVRVLAIILAAPVAAVVATVLYDLLF